MKKQRFWKKVGAFLLAAVLLLGAAVPERAEAATTYKKGQSIMINAKQSYHLMNNNISKNKITRYRIRVTPLEKGTLFDVSLARNGEEVLLRNCKFGFIMDNTKGTYIKSSSSSNSGMLGCIRVHKGSVMMKVEYYTGNKSAALSFKKQAASHQTFKAVKVKKNQKVYFQKQGSNVSKTALIMGAAGTGSVTRRNLNASGTSFENYTFNSESVNKRLYMKKVLKSNTNTKYDTRYGSSKYVQLKIPSRASGWFETKKGSVTFFYPSDYANYKVVKK